MGKRGPKMGSIQTQPSSGLLVLCGSILIPLLICHLLQAGLQLSHVLEQFLELGRKEAGRCLRLGRCCSFFFFLKMLLLMAYMASAGPKMHSSLLGIRCLHHRWGNLG